MGWQKRGFNSPSGHAFLIGLSTNLIIDRRVLSKLCTCKPKSCKADCSRTWLRNNKKDNDTTRVAPLNLAENLTMEAAEDMIVQNSRNCSVSGNNTPNRSHEC